VAVYNYLPEKQAVRLEVQREEWFELLGPQTVTFQVPPGGLEGKPLRIRALKPGKHKLTLRADGHPLLGRGGARAVGERARGARWWTPSPAS